MEGHPIYNAPMLGAHKAIYLLNNLPPIHRDPFDRILVAHAISHGLTILTPDPHIHRYPVNCLW